MNADLLRRAAKEMRERAQAATVSPWRSRQYGGICSVDHPLTERSYITVARGVADEEDFAAAHYLIPADAEHIASWHPAVALAVADWLENEAGHYDATVKGLGVHPEQAESAYSFPLTVARTWLGEAS